MQESIDKNKADTDRQFAQLLQLLKALQPPTTLPVTIPRFEENRGQCFSSDKVEKDELILMSMDKGEVTGPILAVIENLEQKLIDELDKPLIVLESYGMINKNEFADGDVAPVVVVAPIAAIAPAVAPLEQTMTKINDVEANLEQFKSETLAWQKETSNRFHRMQESIDKNKANADRQFAELSDEVEKEELILMSMDKGDVTGPILAVKEDLGQKLIDDLDEPLMVLESDGMINKNELAKETLPKPREDTYAIKTTETSDTVGGRSREPNKENINDTFTSFYSNVAWVRRTASLWSAQTEYALIRTHYIEARGFVEKCE
ncbi:hypothetical protein Tco_0664008 [Tanacetum coccineum]